MNTSILQSNPWAAFQRALGKDVVLCESEDFSALAIRETSPLGDSLYCPYGPAAESAEALHRAIERLAEEARSRGLSYVRIEPVSAELGPLGPQILRDMGLTPAPHDVQPRDTLLIDVTGDEKAILAGMRSSNRNIWRNIGKKGVTIRTSQDPADVRHLTDLLEKTAARGEFTAHTHDYLQTAAQELMPQDAATLYLAELAAESDDDAAGASQPRVIAAALTYDTPSTRVYAHAAASDEHRRLSPGAALVVELILDAHRRGQSRVDMWGIAPPGAEDHEWAGFTRFKKSFGGTDVHFPGTWDLPLDRRYTAYRAARTLRHDLLPAVKKALPVTGPVVSRLAPIARRLRGR